MFIVPIALSFAAHPSFVESPTNVTVNERDPATFTCSATGSGELIIEWICSGSTDCDGIISDDSTGGYVTSTYQITRASASLTITCVVNQSLASFKSVESDIEIRLPQPLTTRRKAELTVIQAPGEQK